MHRQGSRLLSLVALVLTAIVAHPVTAAAASNSHRQACGPVSQHQAFKAPPAGFAIVVDTVVLADCRVSVSMPRLVKIDDLALGVQGERFGDNGPRHRRGDPVATVYQRSWDCCGILMNALYTTYDWNATGCCVTSNNQYNTTIYHTEAPPSRGWYLNWQSLQYRDDLGGCEGCSFRTLQGQADFGYQGVFDPSGTLYDNYYNNSISGESNGNYQCAWSYTWRSSAPGWSEQAWCAYGYNP